MLINLFYKVKIKHIKKNDEFLKLNLRQLKMLFSIFSFMNNELKNEYLIKSIDIHNNLGYSNNYQIFKNDLIIVSKIKLENQTVFSSIKFQSKIGLIQFRISNWYKNRFKNTSSNFIVFELKNMMSFKYKFSVVLYCLLKQYEKLKVRIINLNDLYMFADVENDYGITRFVRNRLDKEIKEINSNSDIYIKYIYIKCNNVVTGIHFNIYKNSSRLEIEQQTKIIYEYLFKNYNININLFSIEHLIRDNGFNEVYSKTVKFKPSSKKNNIQLFYKQQLS